MRTHHEGTYSTQLLMYLRASSSIAVRAWVVFFAGVIIFVLNTLYYTAATYVRHGVRPVFSSGTARFLSKNKRFATHPKRNGNLPAETAGDDDECAQRIAHMSSPGWRCCSVQSFCLQFLYLLSMFFIEAAAGWLVGWRWTMCAGRSETFICKTCGGSSIYAGRRHHHRLTKGEMHWLTTTSVGIFEEKIW